MTTNKGVTTLSQQEPQIGIEPMTAREETTVIGVFPSAMQSMGSVFSSQPATEPAPNRVGSGNEVATEVREFLAKALMDAAREWSWPVEGIGYDVWADADLAADLSDRCDRLIAKEERLKLRVAALRRRARALGVRVADAVAQREPFVICSDGLAPMYVYALVSTKAPMVYRYIGCTDSPHQRLSQHLSDGAAKKVREWVRETLESGHLVQMVELWRGSDRLEAEAQEQRTIADYVALGMADLNVHGNTVAYAGHRRPSERAAA